MDDKRFKNLPKKELLKGAKFSVKNADELYSSALLLGKSKSFGAANSLLILSVEEYIKAVVLVSGFCNVELGFDVSPIFRNHLAKHAKGIEMLPVLKLFNGLIPLFDKRKSLFSRIVSVIENTTIFFSEKAQEEFKEWWKKANDNKNNGFYVGYRDERWNSPQTMSSETFIKSKKMVENFKISSKWILQLNDDDYELLLL